MAEIMKVSTPIVPQENLGNRNKPISDQAFELTDPSKVHHSQQEHGKIRDHQQDGQSAMRESVFREMAPLLRDTTELTQLVQKITMLLQMGISTSEVMGNAEIRALLESLYMQPEQLAQSLLEQDEASVLFKGAAFDLLRDLLKKFPDNTRIKSAVVQLLKAFDQNVNAENSVKTVLSACRNLLGYMFTGDRTQFSEYLKGLEDLLLPQPQTAPPEGGKQSAQAAAEGEEQLPQHTVLDDRETAAKAGTERQLATSQKEAAQILKSNLLPLLGEIVVKYNQNARIRDSVMVVVHNIVRVDQGTPESLKEAIAKLISELKLVANLSAGFESQLQDALQAAKEQVRQAQDGTLSKLASVIAQTLSSPDANAATLRQAENLLMSLLQNQSSLMNVLHFMLPTETPQGPLLAELYVDPDSDEKVGRGKEQSRKIFVAFESEALGSFELSFLESGERVDFAMWCPEILVNSLSGMKKQIGAIMQLHGYTMNSCEISKFTRPQSVADVFPKLLNRKMGVDVRA